MWYKILTKVYFGRYNIVHIKIYTYDTKYLASTRYGICNCIAICELYSYVYCGVSPNMFMGVYDGSRQKESYFSL